MTERDQRNYRSIISRRWKEIKEDPKRLVVYNSKAKHLRNKAAKVKLTEFGDDQHNLPVGNMVQHEENVTEKCVVRRIQTQLKKAPKSQEFVDTEPEDSERNDEKQELAVKIIQTKRQILQSLLKQT